MELDPCHLGSCEQAADMNVMDGIIADNTERRAQAADDAGLFTVRDGIVANTMVPDRLTVPAVFERTVNRLDITFGSVRRRIVPLVAILSKGDAGTSRVGNRVTLDDPAFAPMRAD